MTDGLEKWTIEDKEKPMAEDTNSLNLLTGASSSLPKYCSIIRPREGKPVIPLSEKRKSR